MYQIGDIVFINIDILPFRKVANDTNSWTNHVGIIVEGDNFFSLIAESTFPLSRITGMQKFIDRSKDKKFVVKRLHNITKEQQEKIVNAAIKKMGIFYDTGFDINSNRQFCSRFVHEIIYEATGLRVGHRETLEDLFLKNPNADILFWRIWYFFKIPWGRRTITPASVFNSKELFTVFDSDTL